MSAGTLEQAILRRVFAVLLLIPIAPSISSAAFMSADRLRDFTVQSVDGVPVGKVAAILLDLNQGRIGYLLVTTNGTGGRRIVVPWTAVETLPSSQTLRLRIDAERFDRSPFEAEDITDLERGRAIHRYYGVAPYWEKNTTPRAPSAPRNLRIVQ